MIKPPRLDTYSEAWRHECEARYVVSLPTQERRREYLDGVEKRRGKAERERLKDLAAKIWKSRASNGK